jgi:hypothetical protein
MRKRHIFRPNGWDGLEVRMALSAVGLAPAAQTVQVDAHANHSGGGHIDRRHTPIVVVVGGHHRSHHTNHSGGVHIDRRRVPIYGVVGGHHRSHHASHSGGVHIDRRREPIYGVVGGSTGGVSPGV